MTQVKMHTGAFGHFPEFTRLTFAHKKAYEDLIRELPPVDDISFSALMTWWNPLDNISVSLLNDNLVVPYWLGGSDKHSGLSLLGTNKVDESICTIFDFQRERGDKPRLINVPDYVIANIQYPDLFIFKEEKPYSEYIYDISRFYPIGNMPIYWRRKVQRKLDRLGSVSVVRSLDFRDENNRRLISEALQQWLSKGINDFGKVEVDSIRSYINNADMLDAHNICLFVDGKLHGFCIYHLPFDKRYLAVKHIKATEQSSLGFEYIAYQFAKYISEIGVQYINLNTDQGRLGLRMFMLALGPCNFFRKYIVEPSSH